LIMAPRHKAAMATWTEQFRKCFVMIDLPEWFCSATDITLWGRIVGVDWRIRESGQLAGWPLLPLS